MIMLENSIEQRPYLKQVKQMADQLKTHIGDTLSYDYYQQLLISATQKHDHSNRANSSRATCKVCKHDLNLMSDLTETYN